MPRDGELDRLKAVQDRAFQRQQDAYQTQQQAWENRVAARDVMNRAYDAKQVAYEAQDHSWQRYQAVRNANGPRIDALNAQQETAYQNMRRSFGFASDAHDLRDGASARRLADEGHAYKAESQACVTERRQLVEQIRTARAEYEATKPAFQYAKDTFDTAKRAFNQAKSEHEAAQEAFKKARSEHDAAKNAFKARLEVVKAEQQRRRNDNRSLATRAGVPYQYLDDMKLSTDSEGNINIYFGGVGTPDGPGHGHYVVSRNGEVTYSRNPFDPHGAQNFTEPVYWHKVKMAYDRDSGTYQTDNYIGIVGEKGQKSKAHIAINPEGEAVFVRDIDGEVLYDKKNNIGHLPDDLNWS